MKLVNCHHIRKRRRRRRRRTQTEFSQQQQVEATTTTRETITTTESAQVTNTNTTNSIDRLCYRSANLLKTLVNNNEDSNSNNNSINYDLVRLDQCDLKPIINNCYCSSARPQVCRSHRKHRQTLDIDTNKFNSLTKSKGRFTINFKLLYLAIMCLITLNDNVDFVVDKMGALTRSLSLGSETTSFDKLVCYHWPSQLTLVANKQAIATTTTSQSNCSNDRTICTTFAQDGFCTIMTTSSQKDQERPRPRPTRTSLVQFANADSDANRLYEDLMMPYNRIVRPVQNTSDRVVVRIGLKLSQLMEVEWSDYKLKWDPSEYGGIKDINLPAEQIWLPDIVLYNSAEGYFAVSIFTKAKVRYDGYVVWNPPAIFRSSCQIDITYFPFDSQNCHLKFGSWTFGAKLDLRHINDTEGDIERGTDLSEYYQNVEWDIMKATARRNTIVYDCCPDDIYPDVTFNFSLRRKPLFYTVNLILPCVGITFFSFLVFYLPSDSGEKVTLTISILVSLIFFLSVLIETIPSTSLAMPLLGKYLVFSMILITLSVCATVCVLNIHFRSPSTHSMPAWIKRWCMDILPKYLLMSVPQYQSQQSNILPENLVYLHNQAYANQVVTLPKQPSKGNNKSLSSQQEATAAQTTEVKMPLVDSSSNLANNNNTDQQLEGKQHKNIASKTSVKSRDSGANKSANKPSANRSDARPLELDVANLANGANVFQTRPSTFLPYLHSEAARRLQMQRSRSSERDNKSASDNQQASGTSTSEEHSSQRLKNIAANNAQINVASTSGAGAASSSTRASDAEGNRERGPGSRRTFWRFFRRNKSDSDQAATEQDQQQSTARKNSNTRQHHEHQQIINICRPTHGASSSSSSSSSDDMDNIADEYMHHRHFQARASICSNNLWRIGPTRRCSLTTQANYPTYYRPLTQLQLPIQHAPGQSTSGCGQQQVALAQRPGVGHYHVHADDSVGSSLSTDTYNYQSGATVVSLITATASNLLRPRQLFDSNCQEARCREEREMQPLTSGGFIQNGAQLPHAVGAVPPRQLDTPSSYQSESQHNIPTPPPPLPPEFGDSPPQSAQYSSQHNQVPNSNYAHMDNQQSFVSVNNNSSSSSNRHYQMNKNIMNNSSRQQSNSMLTGNQKVAPTTSGSYHGGYADQYGSTSFVPPAMNQQHINANQHTYFTGNKVLIGGDAQGGSQGQHRQQRVPLAMMANFDSVNLNSPGQQQQQQRQQQNFCEPRFGTGTSASSGSGGSSRLSKNPSMTKEQSTRYLNYGAYGIGGQAMPRSRSTGQQLSSMGALSWQASNSSGTTTGKQVEQTNGPIYQIAVQRHTDPNQQPLMTHGNISNHSIGRQLGQAYIQKLQRQPTVWSLNLNRSLPLAPHPAGAATQLPFPASSCRQTQANGLLAPDASDGRTLRSVQSSGKGHLLPGQYHEPTIDMLRRSKSQTSLSRDKSVHGALNQINDCQHCRAAGANEYRNNRTLDNNNCNLISGSRFAHRPQSEMRGRFNSTGCRFNNLQQQEQSMLRSSNYSGQYNCDDETGEVFHCAGSCAPAMATVAPDDRMLPARQSSKNKSHDKDDGPGFDRAGDGACRCSALERPHSAARSQSNGHQQLSSLSMLKLISEVDKAIQNAMFIAQHIDNLDEFESVSLATR